MLRRKLALVFGSLLVLLLATAVGAIWLLQGVLGELRHLSTQAWVAMDEANLLSTSISQVEIELYGLELGKQRELDPLLDALEAMQEGVRRLDALYVTHEPDNDPLLRSIREKMPAFTASVAALATAQDQGWAEGHRRAALGSAIELRQETLELGRRVKRHAEEEQAALTSRFRALVLGLTAVFLVLINVSVVAVLKMAGMVLRPVEKLIEATRALGAERYDARVEVDQDDEFGELAQAFNGLAAQLEANEKRKLEMMGQVALTLNHELNNAASIIELQLQLLSKQAVGNPALEKCARQIRQSLGRMTQTAEALKHVRRIVLTDYVTGVKMLDLAKSTSADDDDEADGAASERPVEAAGSSGP